MANEDTRDLSGLVMIRPTCWELSVWCARCGLKYDQGPEHLSRKVAQAPKSGDVSLWRSWLSSVGWTEHGTVCRSCSQPLAPPAPAPGQEA